MYLLGLHTGHDAAACLFKGDKLVAFCKEERLNRIKNDGGFFKLQAVDEVLSIAGITRQDLSAVALTRLTLPIKVIRNSFLDVKGLRRKHLQKNKAINLSRLLFKYKDTDASRFVSFTSLRKELGVRDDCAIHFANHHKSHILSSLMFVDWTEQVLLLSCDGGGDGAQYSAYTFDGQTLTALLGDEETIEQQQQNTGASIGLAYAYATEISGFLPNRHEGKLTGLAAFGKPVVAQDIRDQFLLMPDGRIESDLADYQQLHNYLSNLFAGVANEDIAASIQKATEALISDWVELLLKKTGAKYVALSGGVFSNVRLNQLVAEMGGVEEVFVFPAMGDEGLPVGACVDYLSTLKDLGKITRQRLDHVYLGRPYSSDELVKLARQQGFKVNEQAPAATAATAAELLANNQVGAIYTQAMEMGPRALGARTILANPSKRDVNDSINARLQRTEFMPFAPFVCDEDAEEVFEIDAVNRYACRFMTITTLVKEQWREAIAAVVHVDGTARPQIIRRKDNPLYYDVLQEFKAKTGLPVLVNTSFNAHEEPIINKPEEALVALKDGRVDFLLTDGAVIKA